MKFDSNQLKSISFLDLADLNNLEYLNLENNSISFIEINSFYNLVKLETLILSSNKLTSFNEDISIFKCMTNLKFLYLSSNQLNTIPSKLFDSLFKLETLDISLNKINFISKFSFNLLQNLRNLYLNGNDPSLRFESNQTFIRCDSLQNIFLSKAILVSNENNLKVILNLFEEKKKQIDKTVLQRRYFKSLFLIDSNYTDYDCNLTLFFIERNIHFNFKTETHIFDYFGACSMLSIKNGAYNELAAINRNNFIFSNLLAYFFWIYLSFVLSIGVYLCKNFPIEMGYKHENEIKQK